MVIIWEKELIIKMGNNLIWLTTGFHNTKPTTVTNFDKRH